MKNPIVRGFLVGAFIGAMVAVFMGWANPSIVLTAVVGGTIGLALGYIWL